MSPTISFRNQSDDICSPPAGWKAIIGDERIRSHPPIACNAGSSETWALIAELVPLVEEVDDCRWPAYDYQYNQYQ